MTFNYCAKLSCFYNMNGMRYCITDPILAPNEQARRAGCLGAMALATWLKGAEKHFNVKRKKRFPISFDNNFILLAFSKTFQFLIYTSSNIKVKKILQKIKCLSHIIFCICMYFLVETIFYL